MLYNYIIIDSSNLFFRVKKDSSGKIIIKRMIHSINEALDHLTPDGIIYILFDMFSYSDLGVSKAFKYQNERQKILPDYKQNRERPPLFLDTISLFKKYYTWRGDQIQLVYSEEYEADDFVHPLLSKLTNLAQPKKEMRIALLSTDEDWAGFICDKGYIRIDLINDYWDNPMKVQDFLNKFKFKPTYAANILYKSLFGDKPDGIQGALFVKRSRFNVPIKKYILDYLIEIGEDGTEIDAIVNKIKTYNVDYKKTDRDKFDIWFEVFKSLDIKCDIISYLLKNISCIRSQLENKNISEYIHRNDEKQATNAILEASIFQDCVAQFGKV